MDPYQSRFHQQWQHLSDPHVRALAWLLSSPDLLAQPAPGQPGTTATELPAQQTLPAWLAQLDSRPADLHAALKLHKHQRLGLYAENLFAFYLRQHGALYAHGLQVHDSHGRTIGEFDFLTYDQSGGRSGLLHWELATKFYLRYEDPAAELQRAGLYDFLGPNLADTLGAKLKKILQQQLQLSLQPLARAILPPGPVRAQAMIKGWLFYRDIRQSRAEYLPEGLATDHCRAYIWTVAELEQLQFEHAMLIERLHWLPPAQARADQVGSRQLALDSMRRYFQIDSSPLVLALMSPSGELMQESRRGMVVPDDWWARAAEYRSQHSQR
ncbi:MAG: DUF1853 family protein [Burkholderiales bacterium]|nr:DUF1853 family protein [Burkholderiales bacterium]